MKTSLFVMVGLLSLPTLDYAASRFHLSISDTAEAYVARRTAFIARGPGGGVIAGTRRTAIGRGFGYGFLESSPAWQDENPTESPERRPLSSSTADSEEPSSTSEETED